MEKLLLPLLLALAGTAQAQDKPSEAPKEQVIPKTNEALDARYGFLGNKFETPLSSYKGLVLVENKSGYQVYKKTVELKSFGQAVISSVRYEFYKGVLANVEVKAPNTLNNEAAWRNLLKAAYGPAQDSIEFFSDEDTKLVRSSGHYLWRGQKAGVHLTVRLGEAMNIYVYSFLVEDKKKADAAAALKRAAQKL